jgi:predicted amidophosphoribosyltransferase
MYRFIYQQKYKGRKIKNKVNRGENMQSDFGGGRSELWIRVSEEDDGNCNIVLTEKYKCVIEKKFPTLSMMSPTGWKECRNNCTRLWIPENLIKNSIIDKLIEWLEVVGNQYIWLGLNRNITNWFSNELDYCVATGFNYDFETRARTEIGMAEFSLKYHINDLTDQEEENYENILIENILNAYDCLPIKMHATVITPMPATQDGQNKLAWRLAEYTADVKKIAFLSPLLIIEKPQMKTLTIEKKIEVWQNIYRSSQVKLSCDVRGKNVVIIDDLYQSGISMWAYARYLKQQGARNVMGVISVKSQRDSDNI